VMFISACKKEKRMLGTEIDKWILTKIHGISKLLPACAHTHAASRMGEE
jgi:hypothetical protein